MLLGLRQIAQHMLGFLERQALGNAAFHSSCKVAFSIAASSTSIKEGQERGEGKREEEETGQEGRGEEGKKEKGVEQVKEERRRGKIFLRRRN